MSLLHAVNSIIHSGLDPTSSFQLASATKQYAKYQISNQYKQAVGKYRQHVYAFPPKKRNEHFDQNQEVHRKKIGNRTFDYMQFYPKNAKELILLVTGCNTKTIHWKPQIQQWLAEGRAVLSINTNVLNVGGDLLDDNYKMFAWLMKDEKSPFHTMLNELGVPAKIVSHSFGGQVVIANMIAPETRDIITKQNAKHFFINPFLTAKSLNKDRVFSPREIYLHGHAKRNANMLNSEHLFDIMFAHYYRAMGEPAVWASNGPPKHTVVATMQEGGDRILDDIATFGAPEALLNADTHFYIGAQDYMSDAWNNITFADKTNSAKSVIKNAWHCPLHQDDDNRTLFSLVLDERADEIPKYRLADLSGNLLSRTSERVASDLNSLTSRFEGLFGNGIGYAEMGAEAKRFAVNTRNALRL